MRQEKIKRPTDLSSVSSKSSPSAIQLPPACSSLSVSNTAPPEQSSSALEHPLIKVRTSCMWVGVSWGETQATSAVNTTLIFICYINSSSYDNTFSWTTSPKGLENWMGQISSVESFLKAEKSCRRLSARGYIDLHHHITFLQNIAFEYNSAILFSHPSQCLSKQHRAEICYFSTAQLHLSAHISV